MRSDTFNLKTNEQHPPLFIRRWSPPEETPPKATVQLVHGMAEHSGRYADFAKTLTENGFAVYAHDHFGHGFSVNDESELGNFPVKGGWDKVTKDLYEVHSLITSEHSGLPAFLFGHSMGSFVVRTAVANHPMALSGVILSGTTGNPGILGYIGKALASLELLRKGRHSESKLLTALSFGVYNRHFKPVNTPYDWLSRDPETVKQYIDDPRCGFVCSPGFFQNLFSGLLRIHRKSHLDKINKRMPFFFVAGAMDPVSRQCKEIRSAISGMKRMGIANIQHKFYPEGRHEILNELNKSTVYSDIIQWMSEILHNNGDIS